MRHRQLLHGHCLAEQRQRRRARKGRAPTNPRTWYIARRISVASSWSLPSSSVPSSASPVSRPMRRTKAAERATPSTDFTVSACEVGSSGRQRARRGHLFQAARTGSRSSCRGVRALARVPPPVAARARAPPSSLVEAAREFGRHGAADASFSMTDAIADGSAAAKVARSSAVCCWSTKILLVPWSPAERPPRKPAQVAHTPSRGTATASFGLLDELGVHVLERGGGDRPHVRSGLAQLAHIGRIELARKSGSPWSSSKDKSINTAFSGPLSSITCPASLMREVCRAWLKRSWLPPLGVRRSRQRRRTYTQPTTQHDRSGRRIASGCKLERTRADLSRIPCCRCPRAAACEASSVPSCTACSHCNGHPGELFHRQRLRGFEGQDRGLRRCCGAKPE